MKQLLITLSMLFISLSSFCQEVKFVKNEIDEFTGQRIIETYSVNICKNTGNNIYIGFLAVDSVQCLTVTVHLYSAFSIMKGDKLYFKFENGEVKTTLSIETSSCHANSIQGVIPFTASARYLADKELIQYIADNKLVKVRLITNEGSVDKDIKSKGANLFSEYAKTFLNAIR